MCCYAWYCCFLNNLYLHIFSFKAQFKWHTFGSEKHNRKKTIMWFRSVPVICNLSIFKMLCLILQAMTCPSTKTYKPFKLWKARQSSFVRLALKHLVHGLSWLIPDTLELSRISSRTHWKILVKTGYYNTSGMQ
jgi:hypothetical protein